MDENQLNPPFTRMEKQSITPISIQNRSFYFENVHHLSTPPTEDTLQLGSIEKSFESIDNFEIYEIGDPTPPPPEMMVVRDDVTNVYENCLGKICGITSDKIKKEIVNKLTNVLSGLNLVDVFVKTKKRSIKLHVSVDFKKKEAQKGVRKILDYLDQVQKLLDEVTVVNEQDKQIINDVMDKTKQTVMNINPLELFSQSFYRTQKKTNQQDRRRNENVLTDEVICHRTLSTDALIRVSDCLDFILVHLLASNLCIDKYKQIYQKLFDEYKGRTVLKDQKIRNRAFIKCLLAGFYLDFDLKKDRKNEYQRKDFLKYIENFMKGVKILKRSEDASSARQSHGIDSDESDNEDKMADDQTCTLSIPSTPQLQQLQQEHKENDIQMMFGQQQMMFGQQQMLRSHYSPNHNQQATFTAERCYTTNAPNLQAVQNHSMKMAIQYMENGNPGKAVQELQKSISIYDNLCFTQNCGTTQPQQQQQQPGIRGSSFCGSYPESLQQLQQLQQLQEPQQLQQLQRPQQPQQVSVYHIPRASPDIFRSLPQVPSHTYFDTRQIDFQTDIDMDEASVDFFS